MDQSRSPDTPVDSQSRFWVGPLVAGCCFALGYGVTHRVLTVQTKAEDPIPETFTKLAFPGDSLQEIRARFDDDGASLEVDLKALESVESVNRPAKPVVKTETKPDLALQTPKPPTWKPPAWSDPQTTVPGEAPDVPDVDGPERPTAQELDDSDAMPLIFPEPSEAVPAVVVPADDASVLVAEPDPVVVPPGAEAFFQTVDPVIPPQP